MFKIRKPLYFEGTKDAPVSDWTDNQYQQTAALLGFNPEKLKVMQHQDDDKALLTNERNREIIKILNEDDKEGYGCSASTDLLNSNITVYRRGVPKDFEIGVLAHEINHVAFWAVYKRCMDNAKSANPDMELLRKFEAIAEKVSLVRDLEVFTSYQTVYIEQFMKNPTDEVEWIRFVAENLAEMAAVHAHYGELPNGKVWKELYRNVMDTAKEMGVIK